ncbi:hypothetical protein GCM10007981_16180 [Thermocladium modestius]|uniref:Uncharacterized protein n=1 Tax=Thermocladium modestius TaxID=62609 RepID=A0A830GX89_9CREN|nr:DUF1641 domain-containing protein [Thermocladium modestius]GGP21984.1 hypothetical protein GCM10007981_16180 [Thermocladium modestius]
MSVTEEELINYVLGVASQMKPDELKTTVQEATSCILCALYGVSSNVTHETKPVNGVADLIRALNDPYVRKGLGLVINLLRSLGKCLDTAEKIRNASNGACPVDTPCFVLAYLDKDHGNDGGKT